MTRVTPVAPANLPMAPDSQDAGFGALKNALHADSAGPPSMERTAAHEAYREALRDRHRAALARTGRGIDPVTG